MQKKREVSEVNVSDIIRKRVMKYELRKPIFFKDLVKGIEVQRGAAYKAVNKLKNEGVIEMFSKGIYYRPMKTKYGVLGINRELLIKEKYIGDDQNKGYITGPDVWNKWGLTTQVSNRKWISQVAERTDENKKLNILLLKSKTDISKDNVRILQFLDVIEQLNKIPDTSNEKTLSKLINIYTEQLSSSEKIEIFDYAVKYTKRVQVIVGLIADTASIQDSFYEVILEKYKKTIKKSISKRIKINVEPEVFNYNNQWGNEYDTSRVYN